MEYCGQGYSNRDFRKKTIAGLVQITVLFSAVRVVKAASNNMKTNLLH